MIGMGFGSFVTLLCLGFIAAIVIHYAFGYRTLKGFDGFLGKWAVGWIGAWLGSPVLGYWAFRIANVHVIPAIIGAFTAAFLVTACFKATAVAITPLRTQVTQPTQTTQATQVEMRKVS